MVAITVIMAAIIGAFVYGYGGSMTQAKDVAAVARHQGDTIYVTYMGGPDQGTVLTLTAVIIGTKADTTMTTGVGDSVTTSGGNVAPGQDNPVVVSATFTDGTSQVILDTFV